MEGWNLLISSAGRRVALVRAFRRALETLGLRGKVVAADISACASAFQEADDRFLVPRCTDQGFVEEVLERCRQHDIRLVVPTIDTELPIYAAHRDRFADAGVTVAVSSPELIALANDKVLTHRWLIDNDFPTVRQGSVGEVLADPAAWAYPLLVKPRGGSSSIGVATVTDAGELASATRRGDFIVQTIAPGVEFTVDVLVNRAGQCLCPVPRRRIEVRAGEVSKGMTVRDPRLESLATKVFSTLPGAFGVQNLQVFLDEATGELNIIEINPRIGGGVPLSLRAGADYPRWMLEEIAGATSTVRDDWKAGLVMLRFDDAVFVDCQAAGL
jgi:carbamoyl-phosphate synthase large subunit